MLQPSIFGSVLCVVLASAAWGQSAGPPSAARLVTEKVGFESASRPLGRLQERRHASRVRTPSRHLETALRRISRSPKATVPFQLSSCCLAATASLLTSGKCCRNCWRHRAMSPLRSIA